MSAENQNVESVQEGKSVGSTLKDIVGAILGGLILLSACAMFAFLAYTSIFEDYLIYYKDEAFLSNVSGTDGTVTKQHSLLGRGNVYTFSCGRSCSEYYTEQKFVRVKYKIDEKEYENDVWVVHEYGRRDLANKWVKVPEIGARVQLLYNKDDPNDIRLRDDLIIQKMSSGSFSSHSYWIWVVIWGIVGIIATLIGLLGILGFISWGYELISGKQTSKET